MESGGENWTHGGTYDSWQISGENWYSSANAWSDSPDRYYSSTDSYLSINHDIDLSAVFPRFPMDDVWIGFWAKVDLEYGYDYLYVQASKDGGNTWQSIGGLTGEELGWLSYRYMVPEDYLTSQFRFQFNLYTDESVNYDGVYIDDVGIGTDATLHVIDSENITSWTDNSIALSLDNDYGKNVSIKTWEGINSNTKTISAWQQKQHSNVVRDNAGVAVYNNKIYLFGGYEGDSTTSSAEVYDVVHDKWSNIAPMPTEKPNFACELNGKIYCVGGGSVEMYDPISDTYETKKPFPDAMSSSRMANLNNTLYLSYCTTLHKYETVSDTWTSLAPMHTERSRHGMVAARGKIYVFGGYDGSSFLKTGEAYNPATNTWSNISDMPIALCGMGTTTDGDYIYAIGGSSTDIWSGTRSVFLKYDPDIDTWSYIPESLYEILTPKMYSSAVLVPNYGIFSVNGYDGDYSLDELEFLKINWTLIANSQSVNTYCSRPIKITLTGSSSVNNPNPSLPGNIDVISPGAAPQDPNWNLVCDLNNDSAVDGGDLVILAANFGKRNVH